MRIKLKFFTPMAAAVAVAAAISAAPMATADTTPAQPRSVVAAPQQTCTSLGGTQTQCQSPGNVQVNDAPPQVNYFPLGTG
jgi:invasion protein IalB